MTKKIVQFTLGLSVLCAALSAKAYTLAEANMVREWAGISAEGNRSVEMTNEELTAIGKKVTTTGGSWNGKLENSNVDQIADELLAQHINDAPTELEIALLNQSNTGELRAILHIICVPTAFNNFAEISQDPSMVFTPNFRRELFQIQRTFGLINNHYVPPRVTGTFVPGLDGNLTFHGVERLPVKNCGY